MDVFFFGSTLHGSSSSMKNSQPKLNHGIVKQVGGNKGICSVRYDRKSFFHIHETFSWLCYRLIIYMKQTIALLAAGTWKHGPFHIWALVAYYRQTWSDVYFLHRFSQGILLWSEGNRKEVLHRRRQLTSQISLHQSWVAVPTTSKLFHIIGY